MRAREAALLCRGQWVKVKRTGRILKLTECARVCGSTHKTIILKTRAGTFFHTQIESYCGKYVATIDPNPYDKIDYPSQKK